MNTNLQTRHLLARRKQTSPLLSSQPLNRARPSVIRTCGDTRCASGAAQYPQVLPNCSRSAVAGACRHWWRS